MHVPFWQLSVVVHAVPSLQVVPFGWFVWPHTPAVQLSAVHEFPSSQLSGVPAQTPAVQTSAVVHREPSLHVVPLDTLA